MLCNINFKDLRKNSVYIKENIILTNVSLYFVENTYGEGFFVLESQLKKSWCSYIFVIIHRHEKSMFIFESMSADTVSTPCWFRYCDGRNKFLWNVESMVTGRNSSGERDDDTGSTSACRRKMTTILMSNIEIDKQHFLLQFSFTLNQSTVFLKCPH